MGVIAKLLVLLLSSSFTFADSKNSNSQDTCQEMVGVWYSEIHGETEGRITKVDRKDNGTFYVRGLTLRYAQKVLIPWEFEGDWFCEENVYSETTDTGSSEFEFVSKAGALFLTPIQEDSDAQEAMTIETIELANTDKTIRRYFGAQ